MAAQSMLAWAFSVMPVICPWRENGESTTTTASLCAEQTSGSDLSGIPRMRLAKKNGRHGQD